MVIVTLVVGVSSGECGFVPMAIHDESESEKVHLEYIVGS